MSEHEEDDCGACGAPIEIHEEDGVLIESGSDLGLGGIQHECHVDASGRTDGFRR